MKRVFWFGAGAVAGISSTVWAERKVRAQVEALAPDQIVRRTARRAGVVATVIRDAVNEGVVATRERETELRDRYNRGGRDELSQLDPENLDRVAGRGRIPARVDKGTSTPSSRHFGSGVDATKRHRRAGRHT